MTIIFHLIFEADLTADIIPATSYPNTFMRLFIDFAIKIISKVRSIIYRMLIKTYSGYIWRTVISYKICENIIPNIFFRAQTSTRLVSL